MAISGFGRGKGDSSSAAAPSSAGGGGSSSGGGMGNLTAFIDQGSEFEGKLSFRDTVRIDGHFSGEISSDNTLIVGETGQIQATIHSVCVVISGLVEGDVHASDQIVLHKSAVVTGNLEAPAILMEEGAQLNGSVRMGAVKAPTASKEAATASTATSQSSGNQASDSNNGSSS
ncbi:MAG TPA: polymer-forming cytoskeletal protein [Myxococcales bacterium]|nr:polymer-forming cytoskeletal protein [Myxococcales bacterium]HIK85268.1 polymer-forming cytoskeletal protein [Myxococcales bacterium]